MKVIKSDRFKAGRSFMINGALVRGARGLLGWSARSLAQRSQLGIATVQRIETAKFAVSGQYRTINKIEHALVDAGVRFAEGSNGEIGVQIGP